MGYCHSHLWEQDSNPNAVLAKGSASDQPSTHPAHTATSSDKRALLAADRRFLMNLRPLSPGRSHPIRNRTGTDVAASGKSPNACSPRRTLDCDVRMWSS